VRDDVRQGPGQVTSGGGSTNRGALASALSTWY
jgi:hypothetical protein